MYGLVLEGGGSKGAYQIGALKAIRELGLEIGGVAGTSVGALNGAMLVQGDLDRAYDIWHEVSPTMVLGLQDKELEKEADAAVTPGDFKLVLRRIKAIITEKGLNIDPLIKTIEEVINEDKIRKSGMDFGIVTYDLTERRPIEVFKEEIPAGRLKDYLIASASFPGFKLKTIDGRVFIDGGVYNSLPVDLIKKKGYKDIIVIRTFSVGRRKRTDTKGLNITSIEPYENLGPILDFGRERARKNLKLGYFDALKAFNHLKGRLFYISPLRDERYYLDFLMHLSDEKIQRIGGFFGIERTGKRSLFEVIVPKLAELLYMPPEANYEDISLSLLEAAAEVAGIERFRIYTVKELLFELAKKYKPPREDFLDEIPGFLRGLDLVARIAKQHIISCIAGEIFKEAMDNHSSW